MRKALLATFGLLLTAGFALTAAGSASSDPEQLVQQLGSPRFAERQAAMLDLEKLGQPALEALQKATKHSDAEVRRRADELVQLIERRLESERILAPTRVKLDYRDVPVGEAIIDLAKQSGYTLDLANKEKAAARKVTVQKVEAPFWEALDAFCDAAKLSVQTPDLAATPAIREMDARIRAQMEVEFRRPSASPVINAEGKLVLLEAQGEERPTAVSGAVRIRAVPALGAVKNQHETTVALEVFPEPKLQWRGVLGVRLEKAIDETNQVYAPSVSDDIALRGDGGEMIVWRNNNGVLIQQMQVRGQVMMRSDVTNLGGLPGLPTITPLRLTASEGVGKTLKVLKGILTAQVQTPTEPLVTVENLLQAPNKNFRMKDGGEVLVRSATREDNGDIRLRLGFVRPGNAQFNAPPRVVSGRPGENDLSANLDLIDEQGERYTMIEQGTTHIMNNGAVSRELHARFRPKATTAQPKKLVYTGNRLATVDIPFELKDVPLP